MKSGLTLEERTIVDFKYKSKQIGLMDESELSKWGKALLMKIHVITGWTIPNSNEFLNILIDQVQKYLVEKYYILNVDEIEYAFRKTGTTVEDWGKEMNLNLLDKILIPYMNDRFKLSETEEKIKAEPPEQKIFTQDELDDSAREDAERQYQSFLRGNELKGLGINEEILLKDGFLKNGESVIDFFKRTAEKLFPHIYTRQ